MKSYHFDLGNSNTGCVGLCARVLAESEEQAVANLKAIAPHLSSAKLDADGTIVLRAEGLEDKLEALGDCIEYIHVYLSLENVRVEDISEAEDVED